MTIPEAAVQAMPERIYAKVHGASTDIMNGQRGLIGGWNEHQRDGQTEFVRADLASPHLGVKVRGLEWVPVDDPWPMEGIQDIQAITELGTYYISADQPAAGGTCYLWVAGNDTDKHDSEYSCALDAKSAAQADFERRTRPQIEAADGGRAEALEEAARWHDAEAERKRAVAVKSRRLNHQIATHEVSAAHFRALANAPATANAATDHIADQAGNGSGVDWEPATVEILWDELVSYDDRTSPEEYPDMALISKDELADFIERALLSSAQEEAAAARDVLAERRRQIEAEGWTPEHDDKWRRSEMATAAACYIDGSMWRWPWAKAWWKPSDRRRNLVKAGALILAEIERLDRAAARTPAPQAREMRPGKKHVPKVPEKPGTRPTEGGQNDQQ